MSLFTSSVPGFQKPARLIALLTVLYAALCILLLQYESGVTIYYLLLHMCIYAMNKYIEYNSNVSEDKLAMQRPDLEVCEWIVMFHTVPGCLHTRTVHVHYSS